MVRSAIDPIRPGASLILAWQIKHKHVVIIGGGFVAAGRLVNVLEADAKVTVICPENEELSETVRQHLQDHPENTRLVARAFQDSDLTTRFGEHSSTPSPSSPEPVSAGDADNGGSSGNDVNSEPAVDMVLSAIDDIPLSTHIYNLSKRLRIPVNIADVPPQCDFYFCSTHRDKSLQVAVSTSGKGPKLANLIRRHIADHLPNRVGEAIDQVGILRAKLRSMAPGPEVGPKRMKWMSRICEQWKMEDLATLDEKSMEIVLSGFKDDIVYSYEQVQENLKSAATASKSEVSGVTAISSDKSQTQKARLILVGAGPGDPELLTRKAVRLLEEADLVVADRLIPMEVIDLAKGEVRIAPKKRTVLPIEQPQTDASPIPSTSADNPTVNSSDGEAGESVKSKSSDFIQDQLNEWCLQGLLEGKTVVRLKQGDPFIFGRGAEEILFFRSHGFEAEVVPGISSALSAPISANIPLTHRGSSDQIVITTAQAKGGVLPDNFPIYDPKKTVVILMGVGKAKEISDLMQSSKLGWPANIPAVIVENAHCPNERVMDATLETLAQVVEEQKAVPPSVFVVGWAGSVLRG
ncbi:hypothetical protein BGZ80_003974 [Entomortierella chlamydospora]|uniref:precorrin-2 dehydrogenase n=1 Tax=Entomortierella chlamydospora TaxID=101097 RepID=A0A9P6MN15_9FUNG|nr:hypothetical protein BGZ79_007626 [Entomortierella chlamydospora]KAG0008000.1 hypothetical protein BGZ80_003974 [Entomortierella chlamydospora]